MQNEMEMENENVAQHSNPTVNAALEATLP